MGIRLNLRAVFNAPAVAVGAIACGPSDFDREPFPEPGNHRLARRDYVPLGDRDDELTTSPTFRVVNGIRRGIPSDRSRAVHDGRIEPPGRNQVTVESDSENMRSQADGAEHRRANRFTADEELVSADSAGA